MFGLINGDVVFDRDENIYRIHKKDGSIFTPEDQVSISSLTTDEYYDDIHLDVEISGYEGKEDYVAKLRKGQPRKSYGMLWLDSSFSKCVYVFGTPQLLFKFEKQTDIVEFAIQEYRGVIDRYKAYQTNIRSVLYRLLLAVNELYTYDEYSLTRDLYNCVKEEYNKFAAVSLYCTEDKNAGLVKRIEFTFEEAISELDDRIEKRFDYIKRKKASQHQITLPITLNA